MVPLEKALLEKIELQLDMIAMLPCPWASDLSGRRRRSAALVAPSLIDPLGLASWACPAVKQKLLAACCRNWRSVTWSPFTRKELGICRPGVIEEN